ncbi:hypothetical protein [Ruminococcus sp.]|uniref:hypothetical protein n=1 Tax=Ruminococcus sp. TaxID=41978 RepID=UPI001B3EF47E|nr:hypothetical protein [Ruminococcus sp.]MBP5433599.1 hypothetical protein [Ruminococcus sp.]
MDDRSYITKIVTEVLNRQYFKAGDFYVLVYPDGAQQLALCTNASLSGIELVVVQLLHGDSIYHSGAGHIITIDDKNLRDFVNVIRYKVSGFESAAVGSDISLSLIPKESSNG